MQDLYLEEKSEKQFKQNIHNYSKGKITILNKKNINVIELLLVHLIRDITNIVIEYIDDIILINYTCYPPVQNTSLISICSNDVFINDCKYNFKYQIEITEQLTCKLLEVESEGLIDVHSEHDYFKLDFDMLLFFNRYMLKEYGDPNYIKHNHIKHLDNNYSQFCMYVYDTHVYTLFSYMHHIDIKVINPKKLENVISICKLLIEIIYTTLTKN